MTSFDTPPSAFPLRHTLPDVSAGIPGPVGSRMGAEPPFETERECEIVLRSDAVVSKCELVGELDAGGQPSAERIFQADADRKSPQRFVAAEPWIRWIMIRWIVD